MFRMADGLEVLLIRPGGPFWRNKRVGAWMIPKGAIEPGETPAEAALREFEEETGTRLELAHFPLATIRQAGGKYVEALPDIALILPPFSLDDAREAIMRLRIAPILGGVRGEAPLDVDALANAMLRLGAIIASARGHIAAIDLNPVMVGSAGQGLLVLDALIERAGGEA